MFSISKQIFISKLVSTFANSCIYSYGTRRRLGKQPGCSFQEDTRKIRTSLNLSLSLKRQASVDENAYNYGVAEITGCLPRTHLKQTDY